MQRLAFQGQHRLYLLRLPPGKPADASGWPLVVVFHGGGGDALNVERMTRFTELGRQQGFAVLYPQGTSAAGQRLGTWNAQHCCGTAMRQRVDDTGFVAAMLDEVVPLNVDGLARIAEGGWDHVYALSNDHSTASLATTARPAHPVVGYSMKEFIYVAEQMDKGHCDPKAIITNDIALIDLPAMMDVLRGPNEETKVHVCM